MMELKVTEPPTFSDVKICERFTILRGSTRKNCIRIHPIHTESGGVVSAIDLDDGKQIYISDDAEIAREGDTHSERVLFKNLKVGTLFNYLHVVYIKVNGIEGVSVGKGVLTEFASSTNVYPCKKLIAEF